MKIQRERIRKLNQAREAQGIVVYWMNRDQRVMDNWALLYAQERALELDAPLVVFFGVSPTFLGATIRQYDFMLKGLEELEKNLTEKGISFYLQPGEPAFELATFCRENPVSLVVTDFSPLKLSRSWREKVAQELDVAFYEVDAHNIIPCWHASNKQEYAAYTFRPKVNRLLEKFLTNFPKLKEHPIKATFKIETPSWKHIRNTLQADKDVKEVTWIDAGESAAHKMLKLFIDIKLDKYATLRNDPNADAQSNLSPYLHFGHISAQRVAWQLSLLPPSESTKDFLEELIVRKELSDNFCLYQPEYDSTKSFPDWAKKTHKEHEHDSREYVYSKSQLEKAKTHDDLWNAAQLEMVKIGKMHGYMRMYWAKKILEWTKSAKEAMKIAIELNDRYQLDGRDPNGYAGIAWSIGGVHDRAWFERSIFGKIRFMSYNGAKSKFDVHAYIRYVNSL